MSLAWSLRLVSFLVIAAAAPSQNTIVSPVIATSVEGASNNVYPWANNVVRRYQQIHGDIGGTPKLISKLSFRMDANTSLWTGTRAIDLEMFIGNSRPLSQASFIFAQNYIGPQFTAIARKVINMGPQGQGVSPGPNAFLNMDLVLDTVFPYPGSNALVWEVVVYSNTAMGSFQFLDADASTQTTGTSSQTGTGCVATGQTAAMTHTPSYVDRAGILMANYVVTAGPANAPTFLAIGTMDPSLTIPGLCSNLHTNFILFLPIGLTDAVGAITRHMPGNATFVLPNALAAGTLFTQVHSLDQRPGIPVSNSNGMMGTIPAPNTTRMVDAARIYNDQGGTAATQGYFNTTNTTIGYGLVTQFTY